MLDLWTFTFRLTQLGCSTNSTHKFNFQGEPSSPPTPRNPKIRRSEDPKIRRSEDPKIRRSQVLLALHLLRALSGGALRGSVAAQAFGPVHRGRGQAHQRGECGEGAVDRSGPWTAGALNVCFVGLVAILLGYTGHVQLEGGTSSHTLKWLVSCALKATKQWSSVWRSCSMMSSMFLRQEHVVYDTSEARHPCSVMLDFASCVVLACVLLAHLAWIGLATRQISACGKHCADVGLPEIATRTNTQRVAGHSAYHGQLACLVDDCHTGFVPTSRDMSKCFPTATVAETAHSAQAYQEEAPGHSVL